jgi:hypothetical protein
VSDYLALVSLFIESLQAIPSLQPDKPNVVGRMRGLLKTDQPAPTDEEVEAMLEERLVEKYLH